MKHYAYILIYLVSLAYTGLLCSCRTAYQSNSNSQEQSNLSISDTFTYTRAEDYYSRFNLNQEQKEKNWKIKVNFDTTKPADPATGLHPISGMEIEGNENTIKTLLQKNDSTHVTDKQETKNDITFQQYKHTVTHKDADSSAATGVDTGIKYGLIIGIPIILITLTLIIYARYRQKNPSK